MFHVQRLGVEKPCGLFKGLKEVQFGRGVDWEGGMVRDEAQDQAGTPGGPFSDSSHDQQGPREGLTGEQGQGQSWVLRLVSRFYVERGLQGRKRGEGGPMRESHCSVYGREERGLDQGRSRREQGRKVLQRRR